MKATPEEIREYERIALERGGRVSGPDDSPCAQVKTLGIALDVSEKVFQGAVVSLAEVLGWKVYHTYLSIRSKAGYPDLTLVSRDRKRVVWVELKTETGKQTEAQLDWFRELEAAGAEVYLWRPSDWDAIRRVLA